MKSMTYLLLMVMSFCAFSYECNISPNAKFELSKSIIREVDFRESMGHHEIRVKHLSNGYYYTIRVLKQDLLETVLNLKKDSFIKKLCVELDFELNQWDREEEVLKLVDIQI